MAVQASRSVQRTSFLFWWDYRGDLGEMCIRDRHITGAMAEVTSGSGLNPIGNDLFGCKVADLPGELDLIAVDLAGVDDAQIVAVEVDLLDNCLLYTSRCV